MQDHEYEDLRRRLGEHFTSREDHLELRKMMMDINECIVHPERGLIVKLNGSLEAQQANNQATQEKLSAIQATQQKIKSTLEAREEEKDRATRKQQIVLKVLEIAGAAITGGLGLYVVQQLLQ